MKRTTVLPWPPLHEIASCKQTGPLHTLWHQTEKKKAHKLTSQKKTVWYFTKSSIWRQVFQCYFNKLSKPQSLFQNCNKPPQSQQTKASPMFSELFRPFFFSNNLNWIKLQIGHLTCDPPQRCITILRVLTVHFKGNSCQTKALVL